MMRVAITGGIATGKTTVIKILRRKGYPIISLDDIAHQVLKEDTVVRRVLNLFGKRVKRGRGISRKILGEIVFGDEEKRKQLEKIMHPVILKRLEEQLAQLEKKHKIVFIEVPLLFEAELEYLFDEVVLVYAPEKLQLNRLMRKGFTKEQALQRIRAQIPIGTKKQRASMLIYNTGNLEQLKSAVSGFLAHLQISKKIDKTG